MLCLIGVGVLSFAAVPARAEVKLSNVSVGIRGQFQVGRWTSLEADVESDAWPVRLVVRVPDPDGNPTRQPSVDVVQPDASSARVKTVFMTGRLSDNDDKNKANIVHSRILVDVETPNETATFVLEASEPESINEVQVPGLTDAWTQKTHFWAVLGETGAFDRAVDRIVDRAQTPRLPVHVISLESANQLPTLPDALDSLSVLSIVGDVPISEDVSVAVRRWVRGGGHLILSVSSQERFSALPMAEWIPVRVTGQSQLRDLSALTTQLAGSSPIRVSTVQALKFAFDHGDVLASTLDGPLLARVPYGFGRITILAVDLSQRPLAGWESLPQLCERMADVLPRSQQSRGRQPNSQLSQTGVSDLQTQLATGLDQFPSINKPTNWMAMGLILLFLVVVGPLDYLVVHKLLNRPQWTWVTFPSLVVAATVAAVVMARQQNPTVQRSNLAELIDLDTSTGSARVRSWMAFTTPVQARYKVQSSLQTGFSALDGASEPSRVGWTGIPETGFRGMYRTGGVDQWKATYRFSPTRDVIDDWPLSQWSSANVSSSRNLSNVATHVAISAALRSSGGQLTGTLTNELDVPMSDWFIAHEGRVYVPQTRTAGAAALRIAPGETLDFSDGRRVVPRVLQSYMTGVRRVMVSSRKTTGEDVIATRDAYDPLIRDPANVLRMVTFFAAGNGEEFTSLSNDTLQRYDLSPLLRLDRAILFCRIDTAATQYSIDGTIAEPTESDTVLRIVMPVTSE